MINIRNISVRNFLSYGNVPTVFELDKYTNVLIIGKNGGGKSVLVDALCYGLYGKPYRKIKLGQLVNSINGKNSVVTVNFEVEGVPYRVVRGQKPKIFEIYKNEKLVDEEAATRDYQGYLEKQVLKMAYKTFCQIGVMGSANYVPFMSLEAGQRREVIEDVLDISLFSQMNELLKDRIKTTKTELTLLEVQIESAKKETASQKRVVEILKEAAETRIAEETAEIERIRSLSEEVNAKLERLHTMFKKFKGVPDFDAAALQSNTNQLTRVDHDMTRLLARIESIHVLDDCPTCMQRVAAGHKSDIKEQLMAEHEVLSATKAQLVATVHALLAERDEFDRLSEIKRKYDNEVSKMAETIESYDAEIETHQSVITRIESNRGNIEEEQAKLATLAANALRVVKRRTELLEEKELQDVSLLLLKDSGIKAAIIKEYVPILNKMINRYLSMFGFDVNFMLDENFNETVRSRGRDEFTYYSFSEGEKRRIDVAILLAFRKVTELKNSATCNILLMDEIIDSSLESMAKEVLMDILVAEGGNNFVISHTSPSTDMFDAVIEVKKQGDFSVYEYLQ